MNISFLINYIVFESQRKNIIYKYIIFWQQFMRKESLFKQKSRLSWIKEVDSNTKYFHSCFQARRMSNHILLLEVNGQCLEQVGEVKKEVRRFLI